MIITPEVNGLLVPVGDAQALAEAVNRLIENPDFAQQLGHNAAKIGESASAEVIFEEWRTYIEEILNKKI